MPLQVSKCDICSQSDAQVTCTHCEANFCNACDKKSHIGKLQTHQRIPCTGTETPSRFCSVIGHEGLTLPLYCQTCLQPICALCTHGEHKNHPNIPIKSAMENAHSILQANLMPLQANIAKIDQEIKVMEAEVKKLEDKISEAKKRRNEENQKLEDLKSWLNKTDVDPYGLLTFVLEAKLRGAQVIDPICGIGTIPIEASLEWPDGKKNWRDFQVADTLDVKDYEGTWFESTIRDIKGQKLFIHFKGWARKWDEWIPKDSDRLAPKNSHTTGPSRPLWGFRETKKRKNTHNTRHTGTA